MNSTDLDVQGKSQPGKRLCGGILRRMVSRRLKSLRGGQIIIHDGAEQLVCGSGGEGLLTAKVRVLDARFYRHLVFGGSLGAAEAYIRGYWECDDLVKLVRIFCRNAAVSMGLERGPATLVRLLHTIAHRLRRNTESGSRRNIIAHYDLGDEFFSTFLDETMAYSCAIFPRTGSTLDEASAAKFDRICQKLELTADDHVLEIGSGWGGFAIYAAKRYGCRVTTTTISPRQYQYTRRQIESAGLGDRVTVLCEDYRSLTGTYDKLVSIEMIEAVGHVYFDTYFRICSDRLKPDGMMLLQAIIIPDQRYDRYRRSADFIQKYIFPGGCLPSIGAICRSLGRVTDLHLFHLEAITPHYAETLAEWRRRFNANREQITELGFSEEFQRTWEYYFCYCEGGFRERVIGDVQILLTKPESQRAAIVPLLNES